MQAGGKGKTYLAAIWDLVATVATARRNIVSSLPPFLPFPLPLSAPPSRCLSCLSVRLFLFFFISLSLSTTRERFLESLSRTQTYA